MERIKLKAQFRNQIGKGPARRYRRGGWIPAVVYGTHTAPVSLAVNASEFTKSIKGEAGGNAVINLLFEGSGQPEGKVTMVKEMQVAPMTHEILHVDFLEINLQDTVEVSVPVELVGKPAGLTQGGILQQIEREIEVRCLPLAIPDRIEVDVSRLELGDSIHISDISVPEGVEVLSSSDQTIATVVSPTAEVEKAPEAEGEEESAVAEE